ncbi:MAG TPA: cupin domain-containing protein [Trueperaceae bacterium]
MIAASWRSRITLVTVLLLVLTGDLAFSQQPDDPLAGSTPEVLGSMTPGQGNGNALVFMRLTMEPGASIPAHHHPGAVVVVVQSGIFGTEFIEGEGTVARYGEQGTELLTAGHEITMGPGDSLSYEGAVHTMRNDGPGELVLLVSALLDPEQPGFIFMNAAQQ